MHAACRSRSSFAVCVGLDGELGGPVDKGAGSLTPACIHYYYVCRCCTTHCTTALCILVLYFPCMHGHWTTTVDAALSLRAWTRTTAVCVVPPLHRPFCSVGALLLLCGSLLMLHYPRMGHHCRCCTTLALHVVVPLHGPLLIHNMQYSGGLCTFVSPGPRVLYLYRKGCC